MPIRNMAKVLASFLLSESGGNDLWISQIQLWICFLDTVLPASGWVPLEASVPPVSDLFRRRRAKLARIAYRAGAK